jgi:hypothetical protein
MASDGWRKTIHRVHGKLYISFRNETFFVKIESLKFQHLFDLRFCENLQNFSSFQQTFRQHFSTGNKVVRMSWNFLRFHKITIQRGAENFNIYLDKQKSFIPPKKYSVYHVPWISCSFSQQMVSWRPNFPLPSLCYS